MLCIFVDALNPKYFEHMPFLNSVKEECLHGELEVPLGYTGNIASFMTGMWPDKHKTFDLFVPDKKPRRKISNKWLLGLIRLFQNKRLFFTPSKKIEMKYFITSLDKNWVQENCLRFPTLFDIIEKNKKRFESIDWPNHFKNRKGRIFFSSRWENVLEKTLKSQAEFIFVHFLDLEKAHNTGTKSQEIIELSKKIDNAIKTLWEKDGNILVFSDHGMDDINKETDIEKEIKKLGLEFGKDFVYIVGSTTAEFWFYNEDAKLKTIEMLKKLDCGKIVNQEKYHLNTFSTIFLAEFRTAFFPNFFSDKHFKAMHGWDPKMQKTYYILKNSSKKGKKNARMVDFFPTIIKLMNLPYENCDSKSLI